MNSRYRFRRRATWSAGSRFSRRRRFGTSSSSLVRRARGNMRAANNQNDSSNVVINLLHSCYAGVSIANDAMQANNVTGRFPSPSDIKIGTVAVNVYDLLRKSDFFGSYSGMYDQFRINSIKVKITPTEWSVFDQSRSTSNFADFGANLSTAKDSFNVTRAPLPDDYVLNPDHLTDAPQSASNPKFIVPGVIPSGANYISLSDIQQLYYRPTQDNPEPHFPDGEGEFYRAFIDAGIEYLVNIRATTAQPANPDIGVFAGGYISSWRQEQISDVADGISKYNKFIYPQALTVVTAWDRTGLSESQIERLNDPLGYYVANDVSGEPELYGGGGEDDDVHDFVVTIGDNITTYSSAQTKQLVGGANFNLIRYLYPSSQQEKSTYYSTSSLNVQQEVQRDVNSNYILTKSDVDNYKPEALTNLLESPVVPFKPTLLLTILGHNDSSSDDYIYRLPDDNPQEPPRRSTRYQRMIKPVKFNLEFDIGVTFRGLRKTQVV